MAGAAEVVGAAELRQRLLLLPCACVVSVSVRGTAEPRRPQSVRGSVGSEVRAAGGTGVVAAAVAAVTASAAVAVAAAAAVA